MKKTALVSFLVAACLVASMFGFSFLSAFADDVQPADVGAAVLEFDLNSQPDESEQNEEQTQLVEESEASQPVSTAAAPAIAVSALDIQAAGDQLAAPEIWSALTLKEGLKLRWSPVTGAGGYQVAYNLVEPEAEGDDFKIVSKTLTAAEYLFPASQIPDIEEGEDAMVFITVRAVGGSLDDSEWSEFATFVWDGENFEDELEAPDAPRNLNLEEVTGKDKPTIRFFWEEVDGAEFYLIYRSVGKDNEKYVYYANTQMNFESDLAENEFIDDNFEAEQTYNYKVTAFADGLESTLSNRATVSIGTVEQPGPDAPTGLALENLSDGTIKVTWNAVADVDGYQVLRAEQSDGTFYIVSGSDLLTETSFEDKYATPGTAYIYSVRAKAGEYFSANSEVKTITPQVLEVAVPQGVQGGYRAGDYANRVIWEQVAGVDGYYVYRSTNADMTGAEKIHEGTASYLYYDDESADPGVTYYYAVTAHKGGTESDRSAIVSVKTQGGEQPIPAPTSLRVDESVEIPGGVRLRWDAPSGVTVEHYKVYLRLADESDFSLVDTTTETYLDQPDLELFRDHAYRVSAVVDGKESGYSGTLTILGVEEPGPKPMKPETPALTANDDGSILIQWTPISDADGCDILRADSADGPFESIGSSTTGSFVDDDVLPNQTYFYQLTAYKGSVKSDPSEIASVIAKDPGGGEVIPPPTGVTVKEEDGKIVVTIPEGNTGDVYHIYRGKDGETNYPNIGSTTTGTFEDDDVLDPDTTYYYVVVAEKNGELSEQSDPVGVTTAPLAAPGNLQANANENSVRLTWSMVPGATGYRVLRSDKPDSGFASIADVTAITYTDAAVTAGSTYFYRVVPHFNGEDSVNYAATGGIEVEQPPVVVPTPTGLQAGTDTALGNAINLSWTPAAGVNGQKVYRATKAEGPYSLIATVSSTVTEYVDANRPYNTTYFYVVKSVKGGVESEPSNVANATTAYWGRVEDFGAEEIDEGVELTWSAEENAELYRVYCSTDGTTFTLLGTSTVPAQHYLDKTVQPDTSYWYYVCAYNTARGESPKSETVTIRTNPEEIPPIAAPSAVTAQPSNKSVSIYWTRVAEATGYTVYRSANGVDYTPIVNLNSSSSTSFTDTSVQPGVSYSYYVTSRKGTEESVPSQTVTGEGIFTPTGPADFTVVPVNTTTVRVTVQAGAGDFNDGYQYRYATNPGLTGSNIAVPDSQGNITGLKPGTTYYFVVVPKYGTTFGTPVGPKTVTTPGQNTNVVLKKPINLRVKAIDSQSIEVTWKLVDNAEGYRVYRSQFKDSGYVLAGISYTDTFLDEGLMSFTRYYYKLEAYNSAGVSPAAGSVQTTTKQFEAPASIMAKPQSANSVLITWGGVASAEGYRIFRSTTRTGVYTQIAQTTGVSYLDTGVQPTTTYYYKVEAYKGTSSGMVGPAQARTPSEAKSIYDLRATPLSGNAIKLTWGQSGGTIDHYNIYRSLSKSKGYNIIATATASALEFTDKPLNAKTTYWYQVEAVYTDGTTRKVGPVDVKTLIDYPPTRVKAKDQGCGAILVTWELNTKGTGINTGYVIYRSEVVNNNYIKVGEVNGNTFSFLDTGLREDTRYYYKVDAVGANHNALSTYASDKTHKLHGPGTPSLSAKAGGVVEVKWAACSGNVDYLVYRATAQNGPYELIASTKTNKFIDTGRKAGTTYYYKVESVGGQKTYPSNIRSVRAK